MAKKQINTEEELNKVLGVNSIKEISGDKIDQLFAMIPQINPELLSNVITAIPASAEALAKLVREVSQLYDRDYDEANNNEAIRAYKDILEFVKKEASRDDLSYEDIKKLIEEMKEIAVEIAKEQRKKESIDREIREHKTDLVKLFVEIAVIVIVALVFFSIFIFVPGVIGEILSVVVGIVLVVALIAHYNIKKKELKLKAKSARNGGLK